MPKHDQRVPEWLRLAGTSGSSCPSPCSSRATQSSETGTTSRQLLEISEKETSLPLGACATTSSSTQLLSAAWWSEKTFHVPVCDQWLLSWHWVPLSRACLFAPPLQWWDPPQPSPHWAATDSLSLSLQGRSFITVLVLHCILSSMSMPLSYWEARTGPTFQVSEVPSAEEGSPPSSCWQYLA